MPQGKYKRYLEYDSHEKIPRSTARRHNKIAQQEIINEADISCSTSDDTNVCTIDPFDENTFQEFQQDETVDEIYNTSISDNITSEPNIQELLNTSISMCTSSDNESEDKDINDIFYDELYNLEDYDSYEDGNLSNNNNSDEDINDLREDNNVQQDDAYIDVQNIENSDLQNPLCPCTKVTKGEALLLCMTLGVRHSLTWVAIVDMLKVINILFDKDILPHTKYKLRQYFPADMHKVQYHVTCPRCSKYLGKRNVIDQNIFCQCGQAVNTLETTSYFIEFDVKSQLQNLLTNASIANNLEYRFCRSKLNEGALEDIYDGEQYKRYVELNLLQDKYNLSYTFNTDGCQTTDSSRVSMWPIYLMINELPQNIRQKNILIAGLWVHKSEPHMEVFLQPFVDQANKLATTGFLWKYKNKIIHSKIYPSLCCVDSVARCAMLNMKQYNGHFGCTFCGHPTSNVEGIRKYPVSTNIPKDRTDASIKKDMIRAYKAGKGQDINGVWGPSPLMNLQYYDLAEGMVPDYMHSILLGVIQQYTEIILTSVNEDFYVGSPEKLAIINNRLLNMSPPTSISRTPRNLTERKMWKASEWRSWLILYSLICLHGVLPQKYLRHLALFVVAINILLQSSITTDMLHNAERLLIKFVIFFQQYFKKRAMTYNVHLILHLCKGVRNWGPLWTHNTFPFENQNRFLLQMMKNPNRIATEVASRMLSFQKLSLFKDKIKLNHAITQFYETVVRKKPLLKKAINVNNCLVIGSGEIYTLTAEEIACLDNPQQCTTFDKFIFNGTRYTTATYQSKRCKKYNDSVVQMKSGEIGCISRILLVNRRETLEVVLFTHIIELENSPFINDNNVRLEHIKKCNTINGNLKMFQPKDIFRQCILTKFHNRHYVCVIPKGCFGE